MEENKVLQQDLNQEERSGGVFSIILLFKEKVDIPEQEVMMDVLEKHVGKVECISYGDDSTHFATTEHVAEFNEGKMPVNLILTGCMDASNHKIDDLTKSQMWDCPEHEEILETCKYQMVAVDMFGSALKDYKERANLLMDYMEALVEMYPDCVAAEFTNSGKMFTREKIVNHNIPRDDRFIFFAVNVRFFTILDSPDRIVDTLGMGALFLPDLQYHFHDMDTNWLVSHAYNVLIYIYANNSPIKSGQTIDGVRDGKMDREIQWKCQYENALIQPVREVIDINMGEYAAGNRE